MTAFRDGAGLLRHLSCQPTDMLILDIMLPGEDGLSLCRGVRAESDMPILLLTARDEEIDRIIGLELGADDYVCKPFNPRELLARINNVLRRVDQRVREVTPEGVNEFLFSGWRLSTCDRLLTAESGMQVNLSGGEYGVLAVLLTHANRVLSRAQIALLVNSRDADPFDRSVDVRISRLRQLLGDNAREPRIIKTVYGKGYVICGPVVRA